MDGWPGANIDESEMTTASHRRRSRCARTKSPRLSLPTSSSPSANTIMLTGQAFANAQMRFDRLDVQVELALVVHGAAREDASIADGGFERR